MYVGAKVNNICCDCVEMASSDVTCYSINVVYVCGQKVTMYAVTVLRWLQVL